MTTAIRQARRRVRAKELKRCYSLPLDERLVACALQASGRDNGIDLTNHDSCTTALTDMVESYCLSVTRDSSDDEARALVAELMRTFKSKLAK